MPVNPFSTTNSSTTSTQLLAKEVSRLARLGNVQNGLPGAMRALPVAAIVVRNVYAKMSLAEDGLGENILERKILGSDEKGASVMVLEAPPSEKKMEEDESSVLEKEKSWQERVGES